MLSAKLCVWFDLYWIYSRLQKVFVYTKISPQQSFVLLTTALVSEKCGPADQSQDRYGSWPACQESRVTLC